MSYPSLEMIAKVETWRRRMADGTITLEEQKEAVIFLRQNRFAAQAAAASSKKGGPKTKKPSKSADDLLAELGP